MSIGRRERERERVNFANDQRIQTKTIPKPAHTHDHPHRRTHKTRHLLRDSLSHFTHGIVNIEHVIDMISLSEFSVSFLISSLELSIRPNFTVTG